MKKVVLLIFMVSLYSCQIDEDSKSQNVVSDLFYNKVNVEKYQKSVRIGDQNLEIEEYRLFPQVIFYKPIYRIPTIALTPKNTILVACENRMSILDQGEVDIIVARKDEKSEHWKAGSLFQYRKDTGRYMNPEFLVDEATGRIYIFACIFKDDNKHGQYHLPNEVDYVYKFSDDEGLTWSKEISLKNYWNTRKTNYPSGFFLFESPQEDNGLIWSEMSNPDDNRNRSIIPSCVKGLFLKNGTYIIPSEMIVNHEYYSALLIYEDGKWRFSRPTPHGGDNECTVYCDNDQHIVLDCRTMSLVRHKYIYDIENDAYTEIAPSDLSCKINVSTEIINNDGVLYTCYPDSPNKRENLSFYCSKDGFSWVKSYQMMDGEVTPYGYSSIAVNKNNLLVCFETPSGIMIQDISRYKDIINNSVNN